MDNDLFLKRLTELAEWHRPMMGPNGGNLPRKKGRPPEDPELLEELQQEQERIRLAESQPNPRVGPEILRLRCRPQPCPDCDRELTETRRIEIKRLEADVPVWRHRCLNCNEYRHPETGEWGLVGVRAHSIHGNLVRKFRYQQKISGKR